MNSRFKVSSEIMQSATIPSSDYTWLNRIFTCFIRYYRAIERSENMGEGMIGNVVGSRGP